MFFRDVIGQRRAIAYLRESVDSGRLPHAQIISGASGYGGLAVALALASYIFCREKGEDSCGQCPECYRTSRMQHLDMHLVFPVGSDSASAGDKLLSSDFMEEFVQLVEKTGAYFTFEQMKSAFSLDKRKAVIRVAEAEALLHQTSISPFQGGWRVIVIYLPEMMNPEAANKLLKVIEEPPAMTSFILVSEHYDEVLPTIASRCQLLRLPPLEEKDIAGALEDRCGVDSVKASEIAHMSEGSWCRALQILEQNESQADFHELFTSLMRLCWKGNFSDIFDWVSNASSAFGREMLGRFADYSVQMLRDSYIQSLGESGLNMSVGRDRQFIEKFSPFVNERTVEALTGQFSLMKRDILMNGNSSVVLSHFALTVSKIIAVNKN